MQNQKTMLFRMNTEVFAYNSIKNRREILTKSLYAYRLCSKCPPSACLHKLTDDVAIDQWRHPQCACAVPVHTTRQCVLRTMRGRPLPGARSIEPVIRSLRRKSCKPRLLHFLADRTNGRAIATLLRLSSSVVCDVMYCG